MFKEYMMQIKFHKASSRLFRLVYLQMKSSETNSSDYIVQYAFLSKLQWFRNALAELWHEFAEIARQIAFSN